MWTGRLFILCYCVSFVFTQKFIQLFPASEAIEIQNSAPRVEYPSKYDQNSIGKDAGNVEILLMMFRDGIINLPLIYLYQKSKVIPDYVFIEALKIIQNQVSYICSLESMKTYCSNAVNPVAIKNYPKRGEPIPMRYSMFEMYVQALMTSTVRLTSLNPTGEVETQNIIRIMQDLAVLVLQEASKRGIPFGKQPK